jgi:hypothetical protein
MLQRIFFSRFRRMFPTLKVTVSGLDPQAKYFVLMDLVLAGRDRKKFTGKEWTVAGKAEPQVLAHALGKGRDFPGYPSTIRQRTRGENKFLLNVLCKKKVLIKLKQHLY